MMSGIGGEAWENIFGCYQSITDFGRGIAGLALCPEISRADESGISFWLPGQYASLAAMPTAPGWALGTIYYHTSFAISPAAPAAEAKPTRHLWTK
jgi:hypothetical protein